MRVAVTGAAGRLGAALVEAFGREPGVGVTAWARAEFDLDQPTPIQDLIRSSRPDLVIHAAAWTDVDGCAREPDLAMSRNGTATRIVAEACVDAGVSLVTISTNEVFDGTRTDGEGYAADDTISPTNPYGRSKAAGELGARAAYARASADRSARIAHLGIVRTAWLFGPGKPDFPTRIAGAALKALSERRPLRVVTDEVGCPTYVPDLANAIVRLCLGRFEGIHHIVNGGFTSRAEWAKEVLQRLGIEATIEEITLDEFERPSRPPRWGVLAPTSLPGGPLRSWHEAMAERALELQSMAMS
jgi:dTDP-4-dehydrorhamnose reductase